MGKTCVVMKQAARKIAETTLPATPPTILPVHKERRGEEQDAGHGQAERTGELDAPPLHLERAVPEDDVAHLAQLDEYGGPEALHLQPPVRVVRDASQKAGTPEQQGGREEERWHPQKDRVAAHPFPSCQRQG